MGGDEERRLEQCSYYSYLELNRLCLSCRKTIALTAGFLVFH